MQGSVLQKLLKQHTQCGYRKSAIPDPNTLRDSPSYSETPKAPISFPYLFLAEIDSECLAFVLHAKPVDRGRSACPA